MAKRQPKRSERALRREGERANSRLQADRERLFLLEPGGRIDRPIQTPSAAVIETQATSLPCPSCGGGHEVSEHIALVHQGVRLRETRLRCRQCGSRRSLWFQIVGSALN